MAPSSFIQNRLSVIIRTIPNRESYLDKALFSLYCSEADDIEVVVVYQGTDIRHFQKLATLGQRYPRLQFQWIQNPTEQDQRSKNMNLGTAAATGQYIAFLDDDDTLYPHHHRRLIEALQKTLAAWGYSGTIIDYEANGYITSREPRYEKLPYNYLKLLKANFIPIHSYVIDRTRLQSPDLLLFDETFERLEDYAFLLRLGFHHEPIAIPGVSAIYNVSTTREMSNVRLQQQAATTEEETLKQQNARQKNLFIWAEAEARLNALKNSFIQQYFTQAQLRKRSGSAESKPSEADSTKSSTKSKAFCPS